MLFYSTPWDITKTYCGDCSTKNNIPNVPNADTPLYRNWQPLDDESFE